MITNAELTQMKERASKYEMDMFATLSNEYRITKVDVPRLVAEVERLQKALETAGAYGHFGWSWHEHREIVNALNVEDEWFEKNCSRLIDAEFYEVESDGDDD